MGRNTAEAFDHNDPRAKMQREGLYDPFFEHDSCGVGFVVNVDGRRTHQVVVNGITVLKNLAAPRGGRRGFPHRGTGLGSWCICPTGFLCARPGVSASSFPREVKV